MKLLPPRLRYWLKCMIGRDLWIRREIRIPVECHGGRFCDWATPRNQVHKDSVIYSFGVGEDASWDLGLIASHGCRIHAFDPTPKSKAWIAENASDPNFIHYDLALSDHEGTLDLWLPLDETHVSASCAKSGRTSDRAVSVPCNTLAGIMDQLGHQRVDVLKMDVEGAEYGVIRHLTDQSDLADHITTVLIEFHHWMPPFSTEDTVKALRAMSGLGYKIGWVSEMGHEVMFTRA